MHMPTSPFALPPRPLRGRGFTLMEVLVACAIVGILTAIALPAYTSYVIKSKRGAAQAMMMDLANREEQFLIANRNYGDTAALVASGFGLPANVAANYSWDVALAPGTVPGYIITFTAINNQVADGNLTLDSAGIKGPAGKW